MAPSLPDFYNTAIDGIAIGVGVGSCGTAAFTGERVVVTDIATHPFWAPYKELAARAGLGACWSQPIRASTGDILGTFAIYHRDATAPAETDVHLIEQFARLASVAIERDKTAEKIRASVAHYRLLTEGVSDVVWKLDLAFRFTYMSPADERMRGYRADEVLGRHVYELFTQDGVAHVKQQLRDRDLAEKKGGIRQDSITFEVQQHCKDGSLVWTEIISTRERDADDRVIGLHGITRNITDRRQAQEQMHQLAFYDTLTQLANRRLLHDRLSQAMVRAGREQSRLALLFIDLDEFKPINDAHGHDVGDWVLHSVARRIEDCLRASDTAARIGGDEFVVLLPDMQSTADALAVAEKIRSSLQLPLETGNKLRLNPTASIGVAAYPDHGNTEQDLLRLGDDAMYVAKKAGGNRVEMCVPGQAFSSSISSMVLPARLQPSSTAT
jgi:diguanylate cyclase (GGDEF)-like protein/PAS domain S-box-containing protein